MTFSDETLKTYLNGALDEETTAAVDAALVDDEALEARLIALDPLAEPIKEAFEGLPSDARVVKLQQRLASDPGWLNQPRWWRRSASVAAAAGVFGLIAGYVLFSFLQDLGDLPGTRDWHHQVAAYQALYVEETVLSIEPTPERLSNQFQMAESAVDLDLQLDVLASLPTLELRRAQILGYQGTPLVQVAFNTEDGTPIAFCILRYEDGASHSDAVFGEMAGLASAMWDTDTHGFMLIGGEDEAAIRQIAAQLMESFSL